MTQPPNRPRSRHYASVPCSADCPGITYEAIARTAHKVPDAHVLDFLGTNCACSALVLANDVGSRRKLPTTCVGKVDFRTLMRQHEQPIGAAQ